MGVLCTWVKLLTDLKIFGCELQKKCVWRPGPAQIRWRSYSAPPDPLAVRREGRIKKGLGIRRGGRRGKRRT